MKGLQQNYQTLEQIYQRLEKKYKDLEEEHIDASNRFKTLGGDHLKLKACYDQIKDERDQFKDDVDQSKQASTDAASRSWALEVELDHIIEQKAESEDNARAREQRLMENAARTIRRIIATACVLNDIDVDLMDDEQMNLHERAYKHHDLDDTKATNSFKKIRANAVRHTKKEFNKIGVPENHSGDVSSSISTAKFNNHEQVTPIAEANGSSISTVTEDEAVPRFSDTFNAKRQRIVAADEQDVLKSLDLGFEARRPILKTKRISKRSKPSTVLKLVSLIPSSAVTLSEKRGDLLTPSKEDIGNVTPAQTDSTCAITRGQSKVPGGDTQDFTQVFIGPCVQSNNTLSPGVALYLGTAGDDEVVVGGDGGETGDTKDEGGEEERCHGSATVLNKFTIPGGHQGDTRISNHISTKPSTLVNSKTGDIWKGTSFATGKVHHTVLDDQKSFTDGGVPLVGSENESLALQRPSSERTTIRSSNTSTTPLGQTPRIIHDCPPFEQDFKLGVGDREALFTARRKTSSRTRAQARALQPPSASLIPRTPLVQDIPSEIAHADAKAPQEEASEQIIDEKEATGENSLGSTVPRRRKAKGKKAKQETLKKEEGPKVEGANRSQRRAASRERKAAEKRAQTAAQAAAQQARNAMVTAMMESE